MDNSELTKFVSDSRAHGVSEAEIKNQLMHAGWSGAIADQVLGAGHFGETIPMPVNQGTAQTADLTAWVGLEYILMFISLAFSATGVAGLLHHLVDSHIGTNGPQNSSYYSLSYYSDYLVPFYIASLIVSFPVFAYLALRLRSYIGKKPAVRKARVRKFAIYFALIWTFLAMMIRLVETVYGFVKGNALFFNSISHLVVTLLVSGAIFVYFAFEIKQDAKIL